MEGGKRGEKTPAPPPLHKAVCRFDSLLLANSTEQSTLGCFCINSLTGQVTLMQWTVEHLSWGAMFSGFQG